MATKPIHYTLGLDIGIASVGWAVLQNDANIEPIKIENLGVRIFKKAEVENTGASLAADRRSARSSRRITRRRRHRKERIKYLITSSGLMSADAMETLFLNSGFEKSVYELRVEALDRLLTDEEAVRLLIHFAQRRGYRSASRAEAAADAETGKVKQAISLNRSRMEELSCRTFGEMLLKDDRFYTLQPDGTRVFVPHNKQGDYRVTAERSMLAEELHMIFSSQRANGAHWATEAFEQRYFEIWEGQRNFDEGPGLGPDGKNKYSGSQIERMLGTCTFEPNLPRAPKASYSMEYFRLLQDMNNLRLVIPGADSIPLNEEGKAVYRNLVFSSANATYAQLRRRLNLDEGIRFSALYYGDKEVATAERKTLGHMQFYHKLRLALNKVESGAIDNLTWDQKDEIARILTLYKSDNNRVRLLTEAGVPVEYIPALLELSATKAGHLSTVALRKLIPYLEQGERYDAACRQVYGSHYGAKSGNKKNRLSLTDIDEITNPVVRRAVSQSIKVINAIVRTYGPPDRVRIELAREMGKPLDVRNEIKKNIEDNTKRNEAVKAQIAEIKGSNAVITGQDIVKFKLYQEQQGVCLYSGKNLDVECLFEAGYVDIDHIVPYSISFDDSYSNKVLVLASENRQKGNRIPYAYFGEDETRWHHYETLCNTYIRSYKKRRNLLLKSLSEAQIDGFKQRNLVDTQYLSRVVYGLINDHLEFTDISGIKQRTQTVNGAITAQIRKRLGIEKIREDGDLHHAADAAVIACVTPGMIQKITNYSRWLECVHATRDGYVDMETGELLTKEQYDEKYEPRFPAPWENFRKELEARLGENPAKAIAELKLATYDNAEELKPVFVSRMPNHKVTGPAHKDTIRSAKVSNMTISKVDLKSLKLDKNTGEIQNYYRPGDDPLLYNALKERLVAFDGKGEKAFAEPFHKPKHNGEPGPVVKKVKVQEKATLAVEMSRGKADNGSMVRVDVFYVKGDGYYFVPIYVADTVKDALPNRAAVAHKDYNEWKIMKDEDFIFSLYAGDLILVDNAKGMSMTAINKQAKVKTKLVHNQFLYFVKYGITGASMKVTNHDRSFEIPSMGGKTLLKLEKYQVDVLGNISKVNLPEKRMGFK